MAVEILLHKNICRNMEAVGKHEMACAGTAVRELFPKFFKSS